MPEPRKVPSLAELQGKLQDRLPTNRKSFCKEDQETQGPPEQTGRLSLPRRPSLGLLKSQSSLVVPLASTVPEVFVKGPAPPVSDGSSCDPAQPMIKPGEHQLKHEWTLYTDPKFEGINKKLTQESYSLSRIESFRSVEEFARLFNYLKRPSKLPDQTNLAMFKDGIEPTWEAPGNQGGGTWTMFLASDQSIDIIFKEATLALVGAQLPDEQLCGLVVNRRNRGDRLQFWLRTINQTEVDIIIRAFTSTLAIHSPGVKYRTEFRAHEQSVKKASSATVNRHRPSRMPLQRANTSPSLISLPRNDTVPLSPIKSNGLGFAAFAHALPDANGSLSSMG